MTDTSSQFVAEQQPILSQFDTSIDLGRLDSNVQQISALEETWSLPSLPDEVKADLATMPDVDETGLFAFLTGIEDEVIKAREEEEREGAAIDQIEPIPNTAVDQGRILIASLSGNPAPRALDEDAVKRFKLEAIDAGLLDMDPGRVDSSWNPEFNRIKNDLMFQRYDDRMRGDREGAMTLEGVNKLLFDFTSPTGLLSAATKLDLWWDTGAISREWNSWGDKWRELGESKNPIEWAGNLFDALTGPIDDFVLPIVNVGLMFTGVGAAFNTGRIGLLLARGKNLDTIGDIYRTSRLAKFTGGRAGLQNFEELGRPGLMASRLGRSKGALRRATGNKMADWRRALPVRTFKGLLQPGMRLGVVSNIEERMGSFQGGKSLADVSDPVNDIADRLYMAGLSPVTFLPEVMIAPYNIFLPGTFFGRGAGGAQAISRIQGVSRAGRAARTAIGSAPGRAAVGAAAGAAIGGETGDEAGDALRGAAIGAGALGLAPRVGRLLQRQHVPDAIKTGAIAAGAGALLGDDPEDALFGAGPGIGLFAMSPTVRRIMRQRLPTVSRAIRGTGRALDLMSFRPIADKHEPTLAVHMGMVRHLETAVQTAPSAEEAMAARSRLNRWNTNMKTSGVKRALAEEMGVSGEVGDEAGAAGIVWVNTLLGIESIAHTQARAMEGPWRTRHFSARNKLGNQIRPFDLSKPTEALYDDLSTAIAWTEVGSRQLSDGGHVIAVQREEILARAERIRRKLKDNPEWALKMVEDHNKKAVETLHQLWHPNNFPKANINAPFETGAANGPPIPWGTAELEGGTSAHGRALLMAKYLPQIWDRFGNWPKFASATDEIQRARASGLLDAAELVVARTRTGRASGVTNIRRRSRNRPLQEANEAITDTVLDAGAGAGAGRFDDLTEEALGGGRYGIDSDSRIGQRLSRLPVDEEDSIKAAVRGRMEAGEDITAAEATIEELIRRGHLDDLATAPTPAPAIPEGLGPLAPGVLPGRVTAELLATKTSQQLFELREQAVDLIDARGHLDRLERLNWRGTLGDVEDIAPLNELTRGQIGRLINDFFPGREPEAAFRYIAGFAKRKGATLDDLATIIDDEAVKLADNAKLWDEYGLPLSVSDEKGRTLNGFEALDKRAVDLDERWRNAAKEVDVEGLARKYREAGRFSEAMQTERLANALKEDGYRLVHGVEYIMPEDLLLTPNGIWGDVTRKHQNYATLGNFFRGHLPVEGHLVADLRHRGALVSELSQLKDSPLSQAGAKSEEVDGIIDFLQGWLRDTQDVTEQATRHMDLGSLTQRTIKRGTQAATPVNIEDLQMRGKEIRQALREAGYTDDEARAITRATAKFRNSTFRDMGLYSVEAKLRSQNQVAGFLKLLSGSRYGEKFFQRGHLHRVVGGTAGAVAGKLAGEEGDSFEERLMKVAGGGLAGVAAGTVAPQLARGLGADVLATKARDWRYGYMADVYARARDALRFTLSPIFDASRYTEGLILGQTGGPMRYAKDITDTAGNVIHKAGDRIVLPLNLTPRALKRQLSKLHGDAGRQMYDQRIKQFQQFARDKQDFNPEVLDSAGRWFKQVGILGFSPVDWMGTAFARLLDEGLNAEEAYDGARRMYTYATGKGIGRMRSPAELSVNFVLFPFSFQKKALTHLGKWMNDDLGRSILIHDALKTYEILDEEHDLENRWRDYFPWIQQLQRLNLFAYGLSAGRLGGINSQLLESGGKMGWNMFVPQGLNIQTENAEEIRALQRSLLPVMNDINWMIHNYHETANAISSPEHVTRAGERRRGWQEWNDFKKDFGAELSKQGYTLEDVLQAAPRQGRPGSKPWLAPLLAHYEDKRVALAEKYPHWWASRDEAIGNNIALEQARNLAIDRFNRDVRIGKTPQMDDAMIAQFESMLAEVKNDLRLHTGSASLEDAPPHVHDQIISQAIEFARQNPRWRSIWGQYYEKELGPLTSERRL